MAIAPRASSRLELANASFAARALLAVEGGSGWWRTRAGCELLVGCWGQPRRVNPRVETTINLRTNPCADDSRPRQIDHWPMTTTDYLINLLFVFIVARQALERRIDRRYFAIPIVLVFWVGSQYLHTLPTAGNDLVLVAALASFGVTLGTISGLATHIRRDQDGIAFARVGWLAGILLVAGISSRMVFAFAISHGLEPAVRSFSIANHISGAAWPVAMVAMALCEVGARLITVSLRTSQLTVATPTVTLGSAA
jgi:hypothetical protein